MAHFFNYDNCEHKHSIYGFEVKNEKEEVVGYRPVVNRTPKQGGFVEQVSDIFPQLKWKIFSSEKLAREFAIVFFQKLEKNIPGSPDKLKYHFKFNPNEEFTHPLVKVINTTDGIKFI